MATDTASIKELQAQINDGLDKLVAEMEEKGIKASTFEVDSPDEYNKLDPISWIGREVIATQLQDLSMLLQGPKGYLNNFGTTALPDASTLNILNRFNFWAAVPLDGDASIEEIAKSVNLPQDTVRRVLDHATANRFFDKVDPAAPDSRIKHNSHSACLAREPDLCGELTNMLDTYGPPIVTLASALNKWSRGQSEMPLEMGKLPFNYAYSGGHLGKYDTVWDLVEEDGEGEHKGWRQGEMVKAMKWLKSQLDLKDTALFHLTDFEKPENAHIVDVGGSAGYDDIPLAEKYPNLKITVQDLPKCEPDFEKSIPKELRDRMFYQAHSFFDDQPTVADMYLLKYILIDWNTPLAKKIIKALIPALKPGARVLVMELVALETPPGVPMPRALNRSVSSGDMRLMSLFGHSERNSQQIQDLFTSVDSRFEVVKADTETVPRILLLELVWRG